MTPGTHLKSTSGGALPRLGLAAALIYMVLLGGTEVGVFTPELKVVNAVIGALIVTWWAFLLRRGSDRTDLLTIGALVAFLIACVASGYPRQSFEPAVAALGWTAAFGVARRQLDDPRSRQMLVRLLALLAMLIAAYFAVVWGGVWLEWVRLTGAAPPLDLPLPPHIFRHYYVVAMLLAVLLPAAIALTRSAWRIFGIAAGSLSIALIVLTGSRATWLALVLGLAVVGVWHGRRAGAFAARRLLVVAIAGAGIVAVAAGLALILGLWEPLVGRLLASSTVTYRVDLWLNTLALFVADPLTGIGPGAHGIGMNLTGLLDTYRWEARHADNALIQLVGEAGLLGVASASLSIAAILAGWQRHRAGAGVGMLALVIFAGSSLANNPTDSPNLVAVAIACAALAAPYGARRQRPRPSPRSAPGAATVAAGVVMAGVVVAALGSTSAAGILARQAERQARDGDWSAAAATYDRMILLDPGHALYRKERGMIRLELGDAEAAIEDLAAAIRRNPADTSALRALAIAHASAGDGSQAIAAARAATELAPLYEENYLTLAIMAADSSDAAARDAVVAAVMVAPWLPAASGWLDVGPIGLEPDVAIRTAWQRASAGQPSIREAMAFVWLAGASGEGVTGIEQWFDVDLDPALDVLTAVLECDLDRAVEGRDALGSRWVQSTAGIVAAVLTARLADLPELDTELALARLRQPELALAARDELPGVSLFFGLSENARMYRATGLGHAVPGPAVPRSLNGLNAWMLEPGAAALAGAPDSGLAVCSR